MAYRLRSAIVHAVSASSKFASRLCACLHLAPRNVTCPSFEWDDEKARRNLSKHGIAFTSATDVFRDLWVMEEPDVRDYREHRYVAIGVVNTQTLFVVFTPRGGSIRLISARRATRHEYTRYWNHRLLHT
jgi:uncharacterized protein